MRTTTYDRRVAAKSPSRGKQNLWVTKTAARVPPLSRILAKWLEAVAGMVAEALPKNLKLDSVRVTANERNFALVEAKGYNSSDLEASVTISFTVDYSPFRLRAFAEYRDVLMGPRSTEAEFTLEADKNPVELAQEIGRRFGFDR